MNSGDILQMTPLSVSLSLSLSVSLCLSLSLSLSLSLCVSRPADSKLVQDQPCCRAMYSFHPNREGELDFNEGDIIVLTNHVDANWYEGTLGSQSGLFPVSYVDVLVPLPLP